MLSFIINLAKGQLSEKIVQETNLSSKQVEDLFPVTGVSITSFFKDELMNGNFTGIISLIDENHESSPLFKKITQLLNFNFINRLDISKEKSYIITSIILPHVIQDIRKKSLNQRGKVDPANLLSLIGGGNGNQTYQSESVYR